MKNNGKKFEEDFKKSVPEDWFFYRFKDGTGSWGGNSKVRFQSSNICDFMIFNGDLYLLELKSHKGKSLPLSCIRPNQLKEMFKASQKGVGAYIIVNFSDLKITYKLHIKWVKYFIDNFTRKSIPLYYFEALGDLINSEKKITRYRYDLKEVF